MGSAGDMPAPVGDPPTGTAESNILGKAVFIGAIRWFHSVRRVAERNRQVACATQHDFETCSKWSRTAATFSEGEMFLPTEALAC